MTGTPASNRNHRDAAFEEEERLLRLISWERRSLLWISACRGEISTEELYQRLDDLRRQHGIECKRFTSLEIAE